jgi:hypothetical protein
MKNLLLIVALGVASAGCELREITFAAAEDVVVAEVILNADQRTQTAYLHRTATANRTARVHGARVFIVDEARDDQYELLAAPDSLCLTPAPPSALPSTGSCHEARLPMDAIRPGAAYSLRIELPDRPPITGRTTVPGGFAILRPTEAACRLEPGSTLPLLWTSSSGAWVYVLQARFTGLLDALRADGLAIPATLREPLNLLGLAIGGTDTTAMFPGGFGVFDRGDEALHPVLVALREGLPAGVDAQIVVSAADRNYVNWARGGNFNPSGTIRVPSVTGGGTGVFGSIVGRRVLVNTRGAGEPCLSGPD